MKYSKDDQENTKFVNKSRLENKADDHSNYWRSFNKSVTHQGIEQWNKNWDNPKSLENNASKKQTRIKRNLILIRHGHYKIDGKSDKERVLTQLGREQAHVTGLRLADLELPISSVVCSTKSRAQETSEIIKMYLPKDIVVLEDDPILNEGCPYPPEPLHPNLPRKLLEESTYEEEGKRIEEAFKKYFYRPHLDQESDTFEIIICHANVIRYFILRALQLPPEAWLRISLKHASISWIAINNEGYCSLQSIGDSGHFGKELLSTSKERISYGK